MSATTGSNIDYSQSDTREIENPPNIQTIADAEQIIDGKNYRLRDLYFTDKNGFVQFTIAITNLRKGCQSTGHCLDEQTELLTFEGWKKMTEIDMDSMVMTLNRQTDVLEWNNVNKKYVYDHFRKHITIRTGNLDLSLTPDHNMVEMVKKTKRVGPHRLGRRKTIGFHYRNKKAVDLVRNRSFYIPQAGRLEYPGIDIPDHDIALLGAFISEGSCCNHPGKKPYAIRLHQHMRKREWIERILSDCDIRPHIYIHKNIGRRTVFNYDKNYHISDDTAVFYIPKHDSRRVLSLTTEKRIPQNVIWEMDNRQFEILLESMINGDGNKVNPYEWVYYTSDRVLADQLQTMCVTRGYRTKIHTRIRTGRRNPQYEVYIFKDRHYSKVDRIEQPNAVSMIEYSGKSWCVSVRNETIMVRRNGKVAIVGNTHHDKGEMAFIERGEGLIILDGVAHRVGAGKYIFIDIGVHHKLVNLSLSDELICFHFFPGFLARPGHVRKQR